MSKKKIKEVVDPYFQREAEKYSRPIASRELILSLVREHENGLRLSELETALALTEPVDRIALKRRAKAMLRDGQLMRDGKGRFRVSLINQIVRGRVVSHRDGYGFLIPDDGSQDLFLGASEMKKVLHGDRVDARVAAIDRRGRLEGVIVEINERAHDHIVGRLHEENGVYVVVPSSKQIHHDILVPKENIAKARAGQIVSVVLVAQPGPHSPPLGRVVEVLGEYMAPGMEIDVAIRSYELPHEWPEAVEQACRRFPEEVADTVEAEREDIRDVPLVTIDGEDARDFDDAVFCEPHGKGWRLLVAIADVSDYVEVGGALDREAKSRGNSVYFPQRVIPMLPEKLSNGLCSLNPHVNRKALVCELFLTPQGGIRRSRFFQALMRSHARLTYTEVAAWLSGDEEPDEARQAILPHLHNLYALYQTLRARRDKRGAIDFETTETRIVFGEDRKIEQLVPVHRNEAHMLIEECMITANIAAAKFIQDQELTGVFRNHLGPTVEKLDELRTYLKELGLSLGGGDDPQPKHYAKLLDSVKTRPDCAAIQTILLRSLSQAVYTAENQGHFGLALEYYTHFTSPIRRYPDLLVHRVIKKHINASKLQKVNYNAAEIDSMAEHCVFTERRADDATRDVIEWLKCEFMMAKVGQSFEGVVNGVTQFGLFVELKDFYVDGLVHITTLRDDYYLYDASRQCLTGERTGRSYQLGTEVTVIVARVDLDERKIDFLFEGSDETQDKKQKSRKKRRKKRD